MNKQSLQDTINTVFYSLMISSHTVDTNQDFCHNLEAIDNQQEPEHDVQGTTHDENENQVLESKQNYH